jgi:hypothetical protein
MLALTVTVSYPSSATFMFWTFQTNSTVLFWSQDLQMQNKVLKVISITYHQVLPTTVPCFKLKEARRYAYTTHTIAQCIQASCPNTYSILFASLLGKQFPQLSHWSALLQRCVHGHGNRISLLQDPWYHFSSCQGCRSDMIALVVRSSQSIRDKTEFYLSIYAHIVQYQEKFIHIKCFSYHISILLQCSDPT